MHWSPLRRLQRTVARGGRTYDHPVLDAMIGAADGSVTYHVHHDVEQVSPFAHQRARIAAHAIGAEEYASQLREAKRALGLERGCVGL